MRRRQFLTAALTMPFLGAAGRLYALPASGAPRLLVVFFCAGAYDAANIVVPVSSDFYYTARPTLAIAKDGGIAAHDNDWALHPALKDSIYPLWTKKQIAFVPFAGTDDLSRSHFETQDTIELGQPIAGTRDYRSGFMARTANALAGSTPISFTNDLPLSFRGPAPIPNIALNFTGTPGVAGKNAELIQSMYRGQDLAPAVTQGFAVQSQVYQAISQEMQAANRDAVSPKGFELSAQRIGILMRDKFNLGFVDVGGWDTHVNQGGADGYLANRIGELGRGLALLATTLGDSWNNTIVIVVERIRPHLPRNGDHGTDHGHGSVYWVLGGGIRGGQIAGRQTVITESALFQRPRLAGSWTIHRAVIGGVPTKNPARLSSWPN